MPPAYLPLALDLIKQFEGFESEPYQDATGTWTIGYGFTAGITRSTPKMTQKEALSHLTNLVEGLSTFLDRICYEPLTAHQRAACISLMYNIGQGAFQRSTLLSYLNNRAYGAAAAQFLQWGCSKGISLPGLAKRREAEMACFNTKD